MRTYSFLAIECHGHSWPNWPGQLVRSESRIGVVVRVLFRKRYGRFPNKLLWHKDGFMAEAQDHRGNCIQVFQHNAYDPHLWQPDYTRLCLPMPERRAA